MITKRKLQNYIYDIWEQLDRLETRLHKLEKETYKPKPIRRGVNTDGVKKKAGRPRKNK